MNACRNVLANAPRERAAHAGLLLNRYLRVPVKDSHHPDDLKQLFDDARSASKSATALYQSAFDRWRSSLDADTRSCDWLEMQTNGRVVVGLGTETVCETGIALHRIYGVPWIPGAALKGITAHFAQEVASQTDARLLFNGEAHRVIFGDQDAAGYIVCCGAGGCAIGFDCGQSRDYDLLRQRHPHHRGEHGECVLGTGRHHALCAHLAGQAWPRSQRSRY